MIVILSDFGNSEYVGVMKGVIKSIAKNTEIIDLYHDIQPQQIRQGAWILLKNYFYFPKKTIFLCVVDPGVGSGRPCVAIQTKNYFFVGPDNGLVYPPAQDDGIISVVSLSTSDASKTFHGRDIFAKAAAHLERGDSIKKLGKTMKIKNQLSFHLNGREGEIVHIDHFGNIITNIPSLGRKKYSIKTKKLSTTLPFFSTYDEAPSERLFFIEGSSHTLEISIKSGKASEKIKLSIGEKIVIQ